MNAVILAVIELSGGGGDVGALLRIPVPAGAIAAEPGQVVVLADENGKEIPAQVELAGLSGDEIELVVLRPAGMGKRLKTVRTDKAGASGAYWAKRDGDKTVSLGTGDKVIARYQLGVRKLEGHPGHECANFFHPLSTPAGVTVSDDAPDDHLHHRGLFLSFTSFTWRGGGKKLTTDFWHMHKDPGTLILGGKLRYAHGGPAAATLAASHNYVIAGQVVMVQDVIARAARLSDHVNVLDVEIHVTANDGSVVLGKNFYSALQFRGARAFKREELVFTYADGKTHVDVNQDEDKSHQPIDRWFDETGVIDGRKVGATIAVHPSTPRSRLCYARSVKGLNPNFVLDGPVKLEAGQSVRCRYQIYMHDGTVDQAGIDEIARWCNPGFQAKWRGKRG